ncbi:MAG TPA: hypothetical protein PKK74_08410 [Candidatus Methanoculleus thermohydrogenotrophicum]|nr:hypothetical protein [Candidatus Methanoculleus thermohydrogenotrophicum]HPZ38766.1 hypothetical protein [Candidatus Methanoculleus thermohydrogenotrophicum]HQC91938.1 hypothetical protein [Candidatus Methanoculleus thermohydrogenotrophicum]
MPGRDHSGDRLEEIVQENSSDLVPVCTAAWRETFARMSGTSLSSSGSTGWGSPCTRTSCSSSST